MVGINFEMDQRHVNAYTFRLDPSRFNDLLVQFCNLLGRPAHIYSNDIEQNLCIFLWKLSLIMT